MGFKDVNIETKLKRLEELEAKEIIENASGETTKKRKRTIRSFYIYDDVNKRLDKYLKKYGKYGENKSSIVNKALERYMDEGEGK